MSLPTLPYELLLAVCDLLQEFRYINALVQTNKRLYWHLNSHLYSLDVRKTNASALLWAAQHGTRRTALLSLTEGADIERPYQDILPHTLTALSFIPLWVYLTPLQIALCYGFDSVARTLVDHGASHSLVYPSPLCNCTALHMAAAMGLTSTLKALIDCGVDVGAQDERLRTPLHYAVIMEYRNTQEQARIVMLLLASNADPMAEDLEGRRPISIVKSRSSPVARILLGKGAAVQGYEISLRDQETFEMWRTAMERREETEWKEEMKRKQLAIEDLKRERNRNNKKKRVAARCSVTTGGCQEQGKLAKSTGAQSVTEKYAKNETKEIEKYKENIEKAYSERHDSAIQAWSRMRTEADQRSRLTPRPDLPKDAQCHHSSGLWKCRVRKTCCTCGMSAKALLLCPSCGFVICTRCNLGTSDS